MKKPFSEPSIHSSQHNSHISERITASRRQPTQVYKSVLEVLKEDSIEDRPSPIKKLETKRLLSPKRREDRRKQNPFYRPEMSV